MQVTMSLLRVTFFVTAIPFFFTDSQEVIALRIALPITAVAPVAAQPAPIAPTDVDC